MCGRVEMCPFEKGPKKWEISKYKYELATIIA